MSEVELEVLAALELARSGKDFLMRGGAGSGKTYSMLSFLDELYASSPQANVACITFTNVAVNEIRNRFPGSTLHVSTIHEFLWSLIHRFQKNIRHSLAELVNEASIRSDLESPVSPDFWSGPIKYKEWLNLRDGEISHNELLKVANRLFVEHPTLARILADQYDYLLIDEYQDTPVDVLKILLETLPDPSQRSLGIGFFGDGEQAIYEGEKGRAIVEEAMAAGRLNLVTKKQNRRNPAAVIRVINHLRSDGLVQLQANDKQAPNFAKEGAARFIYTESTELDTDGLKRLDFCKDWRFSSDDTKLLYLGKSMIAREKQFPRLMAIYDKDRIIEYGKRVRDALDERNIAVAESASFGEVIKKHGVTISPTPTQQNAMDEDPYLLTFASEFTFQDIVTTSSSSDRLIGTKKVSELDDRDRGEKRDDLINHLIAIQSLRSLFRQRKFSAVIRAMDVTISSIKEREQIATSLKKLDSMNSSPIRDVISFAEESGLLKRKDAVLRFQERHPYRYARIAEVPFDEIANLYEYVEDHSPFSTQHGVKGSEWDNIFVSLDNGGWNNYNFEKLMAEPQSNESVHSRSRMMLYVTCSRAKENLLVYAHRPSQTTLSRAREWFGEENVVGVG